MAYWRGVFFIGHLSLPILYLLGLGLNMLLPKLEVKEVKEGQVADKKQD